MVDDNSNILILKYPNSPSPPKEGCRPILHRQLKPLFKSENYLTVDNLEYKFTKMPFDGQS